MSDFSNGEWHLSLQLFDLEPTQSLHDQGVVWLGACPGRYLDNASCSTNTMKLQRDGSIREGVSLIKLEGQKYLLIFSNLSSNFICTPHSNLQRLPYPPCHVVVPLQCTCHASYPRSKAGSRPGLACTKISCDDLYQAVWTTYGHTPLDRERV